METEKNELSQRLESEAKKIEKGDSRNLKTQLELSVAMRDLEQANSELRACLRRNDALNVCYYLLARSRSRSVAWC